MAVKKPKGWVKEPGRHAQSARGIKTGNKSGVPDLPVSATGHSMPRFGGPIPGGWDGPKGLMQLLKARGKKGVTLANNGRFWKFVVNKDLTVDVTNPGGTVSHFRSMANAQRQLGFTKKDFQKALEDKAVGDALHGMSTHQRLSHRRKSEQKVLNNIEAMKRDGISIPDLAINFYESYPPSGRQVTEMKKRVMSLYRRGLIRQMYDGTWVLHKYTL